MQNTKQTANKELNEGIKTEKSPKDDATGQPPDYNQSMGWQQYAPQHNPQLQYGFQAINAGQYQYPFPIFNQQGLFIPPNSSQVQQMNAVESLARRPTEEDKAEKMKKKLEQRKIPAENWKFYIKAPESWDFLMI